MFKPNDVFESLLKIFTIKKYSSHEHRRGLAWSCDLYRNNKKIANVSHKGCGDATSIDFLELSHRQEVVDVLRKQFPETEQAFIDNYFIDSEMTTPMHKGDRELLEDLIELCVTDKEQKAQRRKMLKQCEKGFCFGSIYNYGAFGFKDTLANIKSAYGMEPIQEAYKKALSAAKKKGGTVLNEESQLIELGLIKPSESKDS